MARASLPLLLLAALACSVLLATPVAVAHTIKHIVVLMQENRSFDHLLGRMTRINPLIDGANEDMCNPYNVTNPAQGQACWTAAEWEDDPDPGHSVTQTTEQIYGSQDDTAALPPMIGFVQQYEKVDPGNGAHVMEAFEPEDVPAAAAFVENFAVFDRWFSSVPGPTQPNRMYLHSATSHGMTWNDGEVLARGFDHKSIFENLDENGLTWKSYFQEVPGTVFFKYLRRRPALGNLHHYSVFKEHAAAGTLPTYSFIDPRYFDTPEYPENDDHPHGGGVTEGQWLYKDVYEILRASPAWENTALLITYDEHGGFFDHVPTPVEDIPNPDGIIGEDPDFAFDRLGVRVPALLISPWVPKGLVINKPDGPYANSEYDHSSVSATLKNMFGLQSFLNARDSWSGSFHHVFNLTEVRTDCPLTVPGPSRSLRPAPADVTRKLTDLQKEFVLLASSLTETDYAQMETGDDMTIRDATKFIRHQVNAFFGRNMYPEAEMAYFDAL